MGGIYSSPYFRTVETAHVIAEITDRVVVPAAEMREYVIRENQMDGFQGATQDELIAGYSSVTKATDFPYPWWTSNIESDEDIEARVAPLVDRVLAADIDALLVGHGASAEGVHRYLLRRHAPNQMNHGQNIWNCFLSSFKIPLIFASCALWMLVICLMMQSPVMRELKRKFWRNADHNSEFSEIEKNAWSVFRTSAVSR